MKVYLVRHGESQANSDGVIASRVDSPLTENGRVQALGTGKKLSGLAIDQIITSPLSRALDTGRIIAGVIGVSLDSIRTDERLLERDAGDATGKPNTIWKTYSSAENVPGIEKMDDLHARVQEFYKDIATTKEGAAILVVTHNGTAKMFDVVHNNQEPAHFYDKEMQGNASVREYDL